MSLTFFNPNLIYPAQTPAGQAGPNAGFPLPFYANAYWYANGLQQTFNNSEIVQNGNSTPVYGRSMPNVFRKDASACVGPTLPV
jgi:hypothetical protein